MTAAQAAELGRDAGDERRALADFSQRYTELDGHAVEARAIHPDVVVGDDLARIPVPRRRSSREGGEG